MGQQKPARPAQKRGRRPGVRKPYSRRSYGTQPGPLTPRGNVALGAHMEAVQTARQIERRYRSWDLLRAGATMIQIGQQLGVSHSTACEDCHTVAEELRSLTLLQAEEWRTLQVQRCEAVILAHWKARGTKASAEVILNAGREEAKLLGTYAPVKITPTDLTGTRPYATLSDDELYARMQALALEAAQQGALPGVVVTQRPDGPAYNGNGHGPIGGPGSGLL